MRSNLWIAALLAVLSIANTASASITYSMTTDSSAYTGATGSSVHVNLYLIETLTGGSTTIIGSGGPEGLYSASFGINNTNSGSATITGASQNNAFSSSFTKAQISAGGLNAAILELAPNGGPNPQASTDSPGVNKLLLGSLDITVGSSSTTYTLGSAFKGSDADANGAPQLLTTPSFDDLAFSSGGFTYSYTGAFDGTPYSFTVAPTIAEVPEPSSMALCGLAVSGLGFGAWRRRVAKRAEAAAKETVAV